MSLRKAILLLPLLLLQENWNSLKIQALLYLSFYVWQVSKYSMRFSKVFGSLIILIFGEGLKVFLILLSPLRLLIHLLYSNYQLKKTLRSDKAAYTCLYPYEYRLDLLALPHPLRLTLRYSDSIFLHLQPISSQSSWSISSFRIKLAYQETSTLVLDHHYLSTMQSHPSFLLLVSLNTNDDSWILLP